MLRIHFLNVGHGDCTIIEHPTGNITMVDINNGIDVDNQSHSEILAEFNTSSTRNAFGLPMQQPPRIYEQALKSFSQPALALTKSVKQNNERALTSSSQPALGLMALQNMPKGRNKKQELAEAGYDISLTNPVHYFRHNFPERNIFRYIQTHPDLDHMRGLRAMREQGVEIVNFWDTDHDKKIDDFKNDADKNDWSAYWQMRNSSSNPAVLRLYRGNTNSSMQTDGIEILSPSKEIVRIANQHGHWNKMSYVLRINYLGYSVILGGDADSDIWQQIFNHFGRDLKCNILKASHHGRDSGYFSDAVATMNPDYTIVSVGKKPETDASNKYRNHSKRVLSTRWYGNLTLEISSENDIKWWSEHRR